MIIDPIVEQLHKQREEYMERFHYDFDAIISDIKEHESAQTSRLVQPPTAQQPTPPLPNVRSARR